MREAREEFAYPWYVRLIFWLQRRRYGRELESARRWGRLPRAFLALTLLFRALDRAGSPIEPALRSLILARVSQLNWCAFCVDLNSALSMDRGVPPEKLAALAAYAQSELYLPRERAALAYAEAVTQGAREAIDRARAGLSEWFDQQAVLELTALVAFQNMSTKFNNALGIAPQGFCQRRESSLTSGTRAGT